MLTISGLKAYAGDNEILKGVDLIINPGETHEPFLFSSKICHSNRTISFFNLFMGRSITSFSIIRS